MKISSMIIFNFKTKAMLCHPTNASNFNSFNFPKGCVDKEESIEKAAIRECKKGISINLMSPKFLSKFKVNYFSKNKNKTNKKRFLFLTKIPFLSEISLTALIVPKAQLQLSKVNWAEILTKQKSDLKIFWRFQDVLNQTITH